MPTKISPQSISRRPQSPVESDQPKSDLNLARHARKCAICNHPDREFIDEDFISWRSETFICRVYSLPSPSSIYRHASATGLLARRRRNLRGVAERILENVNGVTVTANAVIRAMRLFASITEDGQWAEPPKRTIVTHIHTHAASLAPDSAPSKSPTSPLASSYHSEPAAFRPFEESAVPIAPADASSAAAPASPSATDRPTDRHQDGKTPRQLDYLPHWAPGLPDAEILIGVENSSRGDSSD